MSLVVFIHQKRGGCKRGGGGDFDTPNRDDKVGGRSDDDLNLAQGLNHDVVQRQCCECNLSN